MVQQNTIVLVAVVGIAWWWWRRNNGAGFLPTQASTELSGNPKPAPPYGGSWAILDRSQADREARLRHL